MQISFQDIFTAGTETSATTIEWVMTELLKNTKIMKDAQEEVYTQIEFYLLYQSFVGTL